MSKPKWIKRQTSLQIIQWIGWWWYQYKTGTQKTQQQ